MAIIVCKLLEADREWHLFVVKVNYLKNTKHDVDHFKLKDMGSIIKVLVFPEDEFVCALLHDLTRGA